MIWPLLCFYILAGVMFLIAGPAAKDFHDERLKNNLDPKINTFQSLAFVGLVAAGIIFLWPILVPSAWKAQKKSNLFKDLTDLHDALSQTNNYRIDADEFPNGTGDFGSLSNPIPCKSILDSHRYLRQLITPEGNFISFKRLGSFQSEACQMPVDGYVIKIYGANIKTIYLSPYQCRNSRKAPYGFELRKN
jgi:hypothetical protein